jgi:hypothetical protein
MTAATLLEVSATLNTSGLSGIVFDRYSDKDFKFAAIDMVGKQIVIGHVKGGNLSIDASVARSTLLPTTDYKLGVSIKGSTVSVTLNDQAAVGFVFNAVASDGRFGLFSQGVSASFDIVTVKTNDPSVPATDLLASAAPDVSQISTITAITSDVIAPVLAEAKRRWAISGLVDAAGLAKLDTINVQIDNFGGLILGQEDGNTITIDSDAAGWGWFVDPTPGQNEEYLAMPDGSLQATVESDASGRMDLLTAISHEMGHVLGYTHTEDANDQAELMDARLMAGVRELPVPAEVRYFDADAGSFVKGDPQLAQAGDKEDEFLVVMDEGSNKSRPELYELMLADDNRVTSIAPVTLPDEIESLVTRFKKMLARMNGKNNS